jgi:hypothetical protein
VSHSFVQAHRLVVDVRCYPREVLFRTCSTYTDRWYIWLGPVDDERAPVSPRPKADRVAAMARANHCVVGTDSELDVEGIEICIPLWITQ